MLKLGLENFKNQASWSQITLPYLVEEGLSYLYCFK